MSYVHCTRRRRKGNTWITRNGKSWNGWLGEPWSGQE